MAHVNPQGIMLYGTISVGSLSVNGGAVRGEGGPVRPRIVVPLKIEMSPQPDDAMISVVLLTASLGAQAHASPTQVLCQPVARQLISGFPAHSGPRANEHTEDLRFFLTQAEVEDIEALRHGTNADVFTLYLDLDVVVAGLKSHNKTGAEQTSWDSRFGMFSEVLPFWTVQVQPLQINIEQSSWVNNVLPGLGYDQLRLVELKFPPPLPDHGNAAVQFDKAKRALDGRRYDDCIKECRGLLKMWEKQYGANANDPIADIVARDRQWADGDDRRELIFTLWQRVSKIVSVPHHSEGEASLAFDRRDAKLVLVLVAGLSEYLEQ
jgi:hypothetical protein